MMFNGYRVFVQDPVPMFVRKSLFKKHRKKRRRVIVKMFSHYATLLEDGQVTMDNINCFMHCNRKTFNEMQKVIGIVK
jgi:hypothetical protein